MTLPAEDLQHVVRHIRCWEKLRGKRVFLTGASGFVGTWLRESFAAANAKLGLEAELIGVPRESLPGGHFDFGIHAAKAGDIAADMEAAKRALKFAEDRDVSQLLYASSGAVYGKRPLAAGAVVEDSATNPQTSYGRAKCEGERFCADSRVGTVVARMFTFSGPGLPLHANFAVGNFVRDALAGGPLVVQGDGTSQRSYMYAADLAIWLWTLLLVGKPARAYNVGSPKVTAIRELAEAVRQNTDPSLEIRILGRGLADSYVPATERARTELGLEQRISLDDGIRRMYEWHRAVKSGEMIPSAATNT